MKGMILYYNKLSCKYSHIQHRYFEGRVGYRLPRSHVGLEMELEVVGMTMAHSLLTEGIPPIRLFLRQILSPP